MSSAVTLDIKVGLSTTKGRVSVSDLYKALDVSEGITQKIIDLAASTSKVIDLDSVESEFILVIGEDGALDITVEVSNGNDPATEVVYKESDFVCLQATNLKSMTIENTSTSEISVQLFY